jgi:hypothetical protein
MGREAFLTGARKILGVVGGVIRRVGSFGIGAARFVGANHQPISMLLHGLGEASGNPTLKNIGSAALIGSGLLGAAGIGKDYVGSRSIT